MIETVFFDIDGVLTDGMVYVDELGNESKKIFFDDIDAIFALKKAGVKIGFITGENNNFTAYVKKRFEPDYFITGAKDKLSAFKELAKDRGISIATTCFVGDSRKDIDLLKYVSYSFVPGDVDNDVKQTAKFVTCSLRGKGVIKEVAKFILDRNKKN